MSAPPEPDAPPAAPAPSDDPEAPAVPALPALATLAEHLPVPARKLLADGAPPKLRELGAKGLAPGLKPEDALVVLLLLADPAREPEDPLAPTARATLGALPRPLARSALGAQLPATALDALVPHVAEHADLGELWLRHPSVDPRSVARLAALASEPVTELVATNEERLLAHPAIVEALYKNASTRMSTADRILELAVRNGVELHGIPAFAQAAAAVRDELIEEPSEARSFDDDQFDDARRVAEETHTDEAEATHLLDATTGEETPVEAMKPLQAVWADLRASAKIRLIMLSSLVDERTRQKVRFDAKAVRQVAVRDANPLVAVAALKAPGVSDAEIEKIAGIKTVAEDVLRAIAMNRAWTRSYIVKRNLVVNPRTPVAMAAQWLPHMRENDLKSIVRSRDVPGAIQNLAKQLLAKKTKT